MYKLNRRQNRNLNKELKASAASYAKCMMDSIKDATATNNTNVLLKEENEDGIMVTTFFYEKSSYIRGGILDMVEGITGQHLTTYEGFPENLIDFENYVTEHLEADWTFVYGENDDALAVLAAPQKENVYA